MNYNFSQIYTSAKYVRKGDGEGNLTDEIYMIEAVKRSDGCSEFIWKKRATNIMRLLKRRTMTLTMILP